MRGVPKGYGAYRFSIEEAFKGIHPGKKEVDIWPGLSGCGVPGFTLGQQYLIYANRNSLYRTAIEPALKETPLVTGFAGGSRPIDASGEAQVELQFMRDWAAGNRPLLLQGRTGENMDDRMVSFYLDEEHHIPLSGVEVIATQGSQQLRAITDQLGRYRIVVPRPGSYALTAHLDGHVSSLETYDLKVEKHSCAEQDIGMWVDGRVSGSLHSAAGQPQSGVPVQLLGGDCKECRSLATVTTGPDGAYEFRGVAPGEYKVAVSVAGPSVTLPYAARFYPGVDSAAQAVPIRIDALQRIAQRDFTLGARLPTRWIHVEVVWPDGRPVINAYLSGWNFAYGSWPSQWVDGKGHASWEVLADRPFTVEADQLSWKRDPSPVQLGPTKPKVNIPGGLNDVTVRIVIDAVNDMRGRKSPATVK